MLMPFRQYYEDIQKPWKDGSKCGDCPKSCDNGLCGMLVLNLSSKWPSIIIIML